MFILDYLGLISEGLTPRIYRFGITVSFVVEQKVDPLTYRPAQGRLLMGSANELREWRNWQTRQI